MTEPEGRNRPEQSRHGHSAEHLDDVVAGALRGLFGRDSLYMILWAVQIVAAAFVTPVMTRLLDAPNFGVVAAANAVMQVVFVLAGMGLYPAIQRQYARGADARDPAKLLGLSILAAALVTGIADVTGPYWATSVGFSGYDGPVRIAVWWAGTSAVTNATLALLRSQDRLLAFGVVSMLQSVVAEVTSLVLVARVDDTATMFVIGQFAVQVVATVVGLCLVPPRLFRLSDSPMIRRALAFGLPLIPAVLSTFVLNSADRLIVQAELGPRAVARYAIAYNVGAMPMLLLSVLNSSWMPRIFSFEVARERAAVIAASRDLLYKLLMPALIGLAFGAPLVLRVWAPQSYNPDTLLMVNAVVLVSTVPYTAGLASTRGLMAEGRTGFLAIAQITAAVLNVVLNLLLVPNLRLVGSAVATFLAFSALHLMLLARARVVAPAKPPAPTLLVALAGTVAVTVLAALIPAEEALVLRLCVVVLTLAWFGALLVKMRRLPQGPGAAGSSSSLKWQRKERK